MSPAQWYWSHDIPPDQVDSLATPGFQLIRLAHYGSRFAALLHQRPGPPRTAVLGLTADDLATPGGPVAVTVDTTGPAPRFSLVLDRAAGTTVRAGLDARGVHALLDGTRRILDLDTYLLAGKRRYAVILQESTALEASPAVEASPAGSLLFTDVTRRQLDAALREHRAAPVVVRPAGDGLFAAVAEPAGARPGRWSWHTDLDGDGVARKLHRAGAYPADLDAVRTERGARFTVVVRRS